MANQINLPGCTPEPLMNYLKALGVFRLIAEQADSAALGWWSECQFHIDTRLSAEDLELFFREKYQPTPIIGPWGGRSGFFPDVSEATARKALEVISGTSSERFGPFRDAIKTVREILDRLEIRKKEDVGTGDNKILIMRACRNELPDAVLAWLDAVFVLTDESAKYPPLLGTGGNEGSGSYVSTFAQTVVSLLVNRKADSALATSLFGTPTAVLADVAVGHFAPGAIGGPNSSVGFGGGGGANPWDYLLAVEGTLLFAGSAARRIGSESHGKAAFPFTVDPNPVGYGTAAAAEDVRSEMWMPEWDRPTPLSELKFLLAEGRAQIGRRQARTTVDFARSAVTLGVNSGLAGFQHYSVVKRNGLSYFAAYLGRFPVRKVPNARLLDQLDGWLAPLRRVADDDKSPPRFAAAVRGIDAAMIDVCRYGADAERMQAVLRAAGRAEMELANGAKVRANFPGLRPLAALSSDWLRACDDGTSEFRLAASLALLPGEHNHHQRFRMYLEPVVLGKKGWTFEDATGGVVWSNVDVATNLGSVLCRHLQTGGREVANDDGEQMRETLGVSARMRPKLTDVLLFIDGRTDNQKLTELLWALPAVSPKTPGYRFRHSDMVPTLPVPTEYAILKLVFLNEPVVRPGGTNAVPIRNEPRALALLRADRLDEAVEIACRRLQVSGFPTYLAGPIAGRVKQVRGFPSAPDRTRRLLASMLFPLGKKAVNRLLELTIRELNPTQ